MSERPRDSPRHYGEEHTIDHHILTTLIPGSIIPFGADRYATVSPDLATAFEPGDHLHVVQSTGALLHVPAVVHAAVSAQVDAAVNAASQLRALPKTQVADFFHRFAQELDDDAVWGDISRANGEDVHRARSLGRSTTRLSVTDDMRRDMIDGLRIWARFTEAEDATPAVTVRVDHGAWAVDVVRAPLGVVGFVFEGRPNVIADATGVLASGNTAVLRIGADALATAQTIHARALLPALRGAGLPEGSVGLIPVRERSAGWALFSDSRLALAVARGSGTAVTELGSVARQSGIPLSAHGTGGAWLLAGEDAASDRVGLVVEHSLDRKVCNTLNVAVVTRARAAELIPVIVAAADRAAAARGGTARLHVTDDARPYLPAADFDRTIDVRRAEGVVQEARATVIAEDGLGTEWEWEGTPELTIAAADDLDHAIELFNQHSPQFVASVLSQNPHTRARAYALLNAPFVSDGFTRWVDGQYALNQPELGLSNWEGGRLLARAGILTGADLTTRRTIATIPDASQHR